MVEIADVIVLAELMAGQYQAERSGGKLTFMRPYSRRYKESLIRTIERDDLLLVAVMEIDLECTRGSNDQLPALLVCMSATILACRDVIDIEHTLYEKWDMPFLINIGQATARIFFLREFQQFTVF